MLLFCAALAAGPSFAAESATDAAENAYQAIMARRRESPPRGDVQATSAFQRQ
jgi:hypothetical protein